ncbi:MAG: M28 family peptidase [Anaerolineae bacterium]|nr:M28 family peptidase [Anaerolineae bacterium]
MGKYWLEALLALLLLAAVGYLGWLGYGLLPQPTPTPEPHVFDGQRAYAHVLAQTELGPRPTGSAAAAATRQYIMTQLTAQGWTVITQTFTYKDTEVTNLIGQAGQGPIALIGAHYDTRRQADADPDPARRQEPVLGANDGASGVAVLLELAYALDLDRLRHQMWLVFFDAEDNGRLDDWEWAVGSTYMAQQWARGIVPGIAPPEASQTTPTMPPWPEFFILVDMVGDADQQLYMERNSSPQLTRTLWTLAADLGYGHVFIPEYKWALTDDHTPFLAQGIEAVDIIDFDYPFWHTTQDTPDKVAPESLERVGRVLETFLEH